MLCPFLLTYRKLLLQATRHITQFCAKKVSFGPIVIFNAIVCLLVLNVLFFLSSQPLERRCSLTKGVSYFLLILSCPLQ